MTVNDAYKLVSKVETDKRPISCYEYKNYFAFTMIPISGNPDKIYMDSTIGVNKKDGKVLVFNPTTVDSSEMANPVPIDFNDSNGNIVRTPKIKKGLGDF